MKLLSRIFYFENWKIQNSIVSFFFKSFSLKIKFKKKNGTQFKWQWLMIVLTNFKVNILNSRTPATPRTRRRILLPSSVPTPNKTIT